MGSVVRAVSNVLTKFIGSLMGFESGGFTLGTGEHTIVVPMQITPEKVWCKMMGQGIDGCGQMVINQIGYGLGENSIVFYVTVKSESVTVEWFSTC